jgi:NAD(P)-dependent dehydrogenase (short-subunit alcohol dehydrogenase family)
VQVAWIQGASRGIGLALVEHWLAAGPERVVIASARTASSAPGLAAAAARFGDRLERIDVDCTSEDHVARAAAAIARRHPRLHRVVSCAGMLRDGNGVRPERRLEDVDPRALQRAFDVNAIGPLLVAKHALPMLRHDEPAVLANLSARVGSIGDNRLGGWYAYRASKAAQNMLTRTLAIELARRAPNVVVVAIHPGTVETALSAPFLKGARKRYRVHSPGAAAQHIDAVLDGLSPDDSGSFVAWDGTPVPW